jgi:hypothetical protein
MRKLASYNRYLKESASHLTKLQLDFLNSRTENWTWNEADGGVDVFGNFGVGFLKQDKLPVQFNKVFGEFSVFSSDISSLEELPKKCNYLKLTGTKIKSLAGFRTSTSYFLITDNPLTSFLDLPPGIYFNNLFAYSNELISLEGLDEAQYRTFNFGDNPIPSMTLLKIYDIGPEKYYQELLEKYPDVVYDKWTTLQDDLKEKIAQSNGKSLADFDLQVKSRNLIF